MVASLAPHQDDIVIKCELVTIKATRQAATEMNEVIVWVKGHLNVHSASY